MNVRMPSKKNPKKYDVVLYGASGFVGRQTVAYFAQYAQAQGRSLRWAVAGRSAEKLAAVKAACGDGTINAGVVVADAQDAAALDALARDATVVLSTAGPFALYGSELVAACVKHGTHYVDITGETPWVRQLIDRHHAAAAKSGTRIIPFCGFDSIPSDIGTWLLTQAMQQQFGERCQSVKASFSVRGGLNGGTLASVLNIMGSGQAKSFADPFLLNPQGGRPVNVAAHRDPIGPHKDSDFQTWLAPFFMGPINTRVVRRSAALLGYGDDFHYQEYLRMGSGLLSAAAATSLSMGMATSQLALSLRPVRAMAKLLAPGPGEGPSERSMNQGSFRCDLIGKSAQGHTVRATIADKGDPGNRATTKMVCESALCLALNQDQLPGGKSWGGILTPASGLGEVLVARLRNASMTLDVEVESSSTSSVRVAPRRAKADRRS